MCFLCERFLTFSFKGIQAKSWGWERGAQERERASARDIHEHEVHQLFLWSVFWNANILKKLIRFFLTSMKDGKHKAARYNKRAWWFNGLSGWVSQHFKICALFLIGFNGASYAHIIVYVFREWIDVMMCDKNINK